jgi:hypothetical protein
MPTLIGDELRRRALERAVAATALPA